MYEIKQHMLSYSRPARQQRTWRLLRVHTREGPATFHVPFRMICHIAHNVTNHTEGNVPTGANQPLEDFASAVVAEAAGPVVAAAVAAVSAAAAFCSTTLAASPASTASPETLRYDGLLGTRTFT